MNDGDRHHERSTSRALDFQNLKVISAVGRGSKGVVFLAKCDDPCLNECLALKVISKALIQKKAKSSEGSGEYKRVSFEHHVLCRFDHPLLPRLRGVLETENIVGFAIDYCHGGNLHSLQKKQTEKMFSDDSIRFYAAELVLALEYLHDLGIVYRDLKPENVMIQESGHIMLIDFDLSNKLNPKSPQSLSSNSSPGSPLPAKAATTMTTMTTEKGRRRRRLSRFCSYCHSGISPDDPEPRPNSAWQSESDLVEKSHSLVGTEEYVAPEIVAGKGHNFAVDWWSLGVVLYEMLYGTTPFKGENRKETFYRILSKAPELTGEKTALRDLIGRLLEKDPDRRIRLDGIKGHDFFRGVQWDSVLQIARPPYIPKNEVEDMSGFSKNDVELFVHEIFFPENDEEGEKNRVVEKNNVQNNKTEWVGKLSHNPTENEFFFIF